jgi:hypothetical protein
MEHKTATYRLHINRKHSLPLTPKKKQTELTIIQLIARNNNFLQKPIQNPNLQLQHKKTNQYQINGGKNKKKDNFHILQLKYKENHEPIQAHEYRNIQEYQYPTTHKTKTDQ